MNPGVQTFGEAAAWIETGRIVLSVFSPIFRLFLVAVATLRVECGRAQSPASPNATAPAVANELRVRVVDRNGDIIPTARVQVNGLEDRQDAAPKGVVRGIGTGPANLVVTAKGFRPWRSTVTIARDGLTEVEARLELEAVASAIEVVATMTEVSGGITKSSVPILETPQSISLVTREEMTLRAPLNMQEALRYTPGVRAERFGFDARGDWASIRGGSFGQFQNGMRSLVGFYNNVRPDPFALEQIEVMRGPSSVLFGQGGFGGVINLVTKRPLETPRGEVQVQLGSFGRKQIGVDLTGPVPGQSALAYRLVGVARESGTQVNYVPDDRILVNPAVSWRPTNVTRLTLLGNFQEDRMGSSVGFFPWRGTLLPNGAGPIHTSTFISEPGFDEYLSGARSGGYLLEHTFNRRWTVRQNFNYAHSYVSYQSIWADFRTGILPDGRSVNRTSYINKPFFNSPTLDTNVETRARTGAVRHFLLAGLDFQQSSITGVTASGTAPAIDVYAPVYGNYTAPRAAPFPKSRQQQRGAYVQDQLKFGESLSLNLALRRDWATAETVGNRASLLDTTAWTGRAGLVYTLPKGLVPYLSYSESFQPLAGFDFFNNPYQPQRGKQWEYGLKFQSPGNRLYLTAAWFDLRETNRLTPDPANARNSIQVGEVQSRGAEAEIRARLPWSTDLISSYTYNLARVSRSNSTDLGKRLSNMPLHFGSFWLTKQFRVSANSRILLGPGLRYTGSSFDGVDILRTPAYALFDATAAWENPTWRVAFNGANVGDKVYLASCLARGDCFFGARRNAVATVSYRF
jgi:iron complex outermembrane recepter protein